MKARALPPYRSCVGGLVVSGTLIWRAWQSGRAHDHFSTTNFAFMAVGGLLLVGVLVLAVRMRGYRIDGDRLVVTRLLSPRGIASHPLSDVEVLARHKGGLEIVLKGGTSYAVFDSLAGAPEMIRLLLSDEVRGPGFEPARVVQARV